MHRTHAALAALLVLALAMGAAAATPEEQARSWQKQANDTRAAVVGVAEELEALGDHGNETAAALIVDAKRWLAEGDQSRSQADSKMQAADFLAASQDYNMAWQYYVKAATAGLNARRMLTGK